MANVTDVESKRQLPVLDQNSGQKTKIRIAEILLSVGVALPAAYAFIAIQYGAIVFPYYDHMIYVKFIAAFRDGTLHFWDLFEAEAQTRPFVSRTIMLVNAMMTNWDVRSEFIYIEISIFGVLAAHLLCLRQLSQNLARWPFLLIATIISIFVFSPVGNQNEVWSLMFLSTLANMFVTIMLLMVALRPQSWSVNVGAALLGWLAAYSLSNGIFAIAAVAVTHQLASPRLFAMNRLVIFWLVTLVVLVAVYIPGVPLNHGTPSLLPGVLFFFMYIGSPLASLLWFPFHFYLEVPPSGLMSGIAGVILVLAVALVAACGGLRDLRAGRPEAFILFSFSFFSLICAVVTSWGRVGIGEDTDLAIRAAMSSRYAIFGTYLVIGLVYYWIIGFARSGASLAHLPWRGYGYGLAVALFLGLATMSYVKGAHIYATARDFNYGLANYFPPRGAPTELDVGLFPDVAYARWAKTALYRLGMGPYRLAPQRVVPLTEGASIGAVALTSGTRVTQRFKREHGRLFSLAMPFMSFANTRFKYSINWKVTAIAGVDRRPIAAGTIQGKDLYNWLYIDLKTAKLDVPGDELELELLVISNEPATTKLTEVPEFQMAPGLIPVAVDGKPVAGAALGLRANYDFE